MVIFAAVLQRLVTVREATQELARCVRLWAAGRPAWLVQQRMTAMITPDQGHRFGRMLRVAAGQLIAPKVRAV